MDYLIEDKRGVGYLCITLLFRGRAFFARPTESAMQGYELRLDISPLTRTISCTGGDNMKAITYTTARQNLAKTMESVCRDRSPVIVTRKSSESVVIMSLEDFEALEETAYLLRSPKNTRRLIESIAQLESGEGSEKELIE
jgi:antitoxin YefM